MRFTIFLGVFVRDFDKYMLNYSILTALTVRCKRMKLTTSLQHLLLSRIVIGLF